MLTVKCPKCAVAMKLAQAPASGRVKCPKCATVVAVNPAGKAGAAPTRQPAQRTAPMAAVDPDDDNFDFGRISFPSASATAAVSHFPVAGQASMYEGPIPGDPLAPEPDKSDGAGGDGDAPPASGKKKKKGGMSTTAIVRMSIGLLLLIVCSTIGGLIWRQRMNAGPSEAEAIAKLQVSAPDGYQAVGIEGVLVLMPKGSAYDNLPSVIDCKAVSTFESQSTYFLGAMNGGKRPLDKDQMRKKAERQLGGEILGGQEMERNGYKGIKGVLDGSIFLPRMQVEVFHVDERFCILGCAPKSMGADPSVPVDRALEAEEQEVFYKSFTIGPIPSGFFGN
ncbi:hypothetical protein Poly51_56080 [Rubripirellula tenax]|uniref:Zinc finger/thioredoxin putative domain-containing protein n=1 Tax=Rubripirellula tenax TaxID=2528015 RepID=A0A5C6EB63_9BACT|nr:hypothetical protein [Rubripirellula tenax]TWU46212.1 hypothetical protein Poly51_56080 [Rubripirellula tenax]